MQDEIFDVVDEQDRVIGQLSRGEIHRRQLRHRAAHILVFNAQGELFLQRRSLKKECCPGLWDSSVAGHLDRGESYEDCARREIEEEIGYRLGGPLTRLFKLDACPETGWEFVWVYRCEADGPFSLHPEEIEEGRWFTVTALEPWIRERPDDFSSTLRLIWGRMRDALPIAQSLNG